MSELPMRSLRSGREKYPVSSGGLGESKRGTNKNAVPPIMWYHIYLRFPAMNADTFFALPPEDNY